MSKEEIKNESYIVIKIDFKRKENSFILENVKDSYIDFLKNNNRLQYFFNELIPNIKNSIKDTSMSKDINYIDTKKDVCSYCGYEESGSWGYRES